MTTGFSNVAHQFKLNTGLVKGMIQAVPPDRWFTRPGEDSNHMMWITGHLVVSRAQVLKTLGESWEAPWTALFARGAKLVEAEQYPSTAEIVRAWDEVSEKLAIVLNNASPDQLEKPVNGGGAPAFDGMVSGRIAFLSLHETYHVGQIGFLRKWLGCGQTVG